MIANRVKTQHIRHISKQSGAPRSKVDYRNIEEVPNRCGGGCAVVAGTRSLVHPESRKAALDH